MVAAGKCLRSVADARHALPSDAGRSSTRTGWATGCVHEQGFVGLGESVWKTLSRAPGEAVSKARAVPWGTPSFVCGQKGEQPGAGGTLENLTRLPKSLTQTLS